MACHVPFRSILHFTTLPNVLRTSRKLSTIFTYTVEHQIIHYINFVCLSRGRTNLQKLHVVKMDGGDSSHSSSAKIKLIALVVAKKNMFLNLHLYEHLKLGRL